jgi:hypothetical protein
MCTTHCCAAWGNGSGKAWQQRCQIFCTTYQKRGQIYQIVFQTAVKHAKCPYAINHLATLLGSQKNKMVLILLYPFVFLRFLSK